MSDAVTIIECSSSWPRSAADLVSFLKRKGDVYVLEPFAAYHHMGKSRFFPAFFPSCVEELIAEGRLQTLPAQDIDPDVLMFAAWEKAMGKLDVTFASARKKWRRPQDRIVQELGGDAEKAFRQSLADQLGVFFSVNVLLHRLAILFPEKQLEVYSGCCPVLYQKMLVLLQDSGVDVSTPVHVRLRSANPIRRAFGRWARHIAVLGYFALQSVLAFFPFRGRAQIHSRTSTIGMNLNAPGRQLRNRQMGVDFVVDGVNVRREDMLYVLPGSSLRPGMGISLTPKQEERLHEIGGAALSTPSAWTFASPAGLWFSLFMYGVWSGPDNGLVCRPAAVVCTHYYRWRQVARALRLRHFVAYADFGPSHVGRNIALHEAGTRTWYVQDSNNSSIIFRNNTADRPPLHPFWTDLHYTDMACWCEASAEYYRAHGFSGRSHVVGCLRSDSLRGKVKARKNEHFAGISLQDFVLAVFDSTYTAKTHTPYEAGIAFAKDVLRLADESTGVHILFKEKKDRTFHLSIHPELGKALVALYERMDRHPRITMCTPSMDAATIISGADMTISFPFTSTTFEAVAGNRYALWHDASGMFRDTLYASFPGLVSHTYQELRERVMVRQKDPDAAFAAPIPLSSPHMDPFRDGLALERLRKLISSSQFRTTSAKLAETVENG